MPSPIWEVRDLEFVRRCGIESFDIGAEYSHEQRERAKALAVFYRQGKRDARLRQITWLFITAALVCFWALIGLTLNHWMRWF